MAILVLICGLPGAGKTTLAKELERRLPALRLSPDEWIAELLAEASDTGERDRLRSLVEALQWAVAARVLELGGNVVLEWGFWAREERAHYRRLGEALGARVEFRFLEWGFEELWRRIERRNAALPDGTFPICFGELKAWWELYEPATGEELNLQAGG
jgi:predicted kinase